MCTLVGLDASMLVKKQMKLILLLHQLTVKEKNQKNKNKKFDTLFVIFANFL
jgi:hypothetical protein